MVATSVTLGNPNNIALTLEPTLIAMRNQSLGTLNLSFNCDLLCWDAFKVGQSSMQDVQRWFSEKYQVPRGSVGGASEKYNYFQVDIGGAEIATFADAQSPVPSLHAFFIGFSLSNSSDGTKYPSIAPLLPRLVLRQNTTLRYPLRVDILVNPNLTTYYVIYSYDTWALQYIVSNSPRKDANNRSCFFSGEQPAPVIWALNPQEKNLVELVKSLSSYENAGILFPLKLANAKAVLTLADKANIVESIVPATGELCVLLPT
jgi:hypothetical protein